MRSESHLLKLDGVRKPRLSVGDRLAMDRSRGTGRGVYLTGARTSLEAFLYDFFVLILKRVQHRYKEAKIKAVQKRLRIERMRDIFLKELDLSVNTFLRDDNKDSDFLNAIFGRPI
jgi:hypothetical protein